jgi:hypothetical protein
VGDISFDCIYYKSKTKKNTFTHLLEDLIGLENNERFTEVAESFMLCEALKTSYAEAAKVLPSKQEITKITVMNKVHGEYKYGGTESIRQDGSRAGES